MIFVFAKEGYDLEVLMQQATEPNYNRLLESGRQKIQHNDPRGGWRLRAGATIEA